MPETTPSVYKSLSWLLGILLIGSTALLIWYSGNQRQALAGKDARIAESAQLVADTKRKLDQSEEASKALGTEKQALMDKLDAAAQAHQKLLGDVEALKVEHAQTLAAEQDKARQAYAKLQDQHTAANERIAALGTEMEQLSNTMAKERASHKTRMAEAEAAHKALMLELEQQLNERIDFYRTSLEGSDPERAAQLESFENKLQESQQDIDEATQLVQRMREEEADLQARLAAADRVMEEREQALAATAQELKAAQANLAQEQTAHAALQRTHEAAVAEATEAQAKLQQELQAAEAAHEKAKTEAAAAQQAAEKAHAARMTEAESKISNLTARLQSETAALGILQEQHTTIVSELRGSLEAAKQTLAGVEAELSATKDAAAQEKQAQEQQIAEAQSTISDLQQTLEQTRQKAAQDLADSQRAGAEALAYVRELYTDFAKLGGQHSEQGMLLSLAEDELRFRVSKADLPEGELKSLDRISQLLAKHPKLSARIEGHTDDSGREETNLELSRQRADAVKQALVERGIDAQRMTAEGIGEARPIADNTSSAGRRKNRRVEIYVIEN